VFSSENSQGHSVAVHSRALKEPVIQDFKTSAKKDEAIVALSSRHPASTWACRSLLHRASETLSAGKSTKSACRMSSAIIAGLKRPEHQWNSRDSDSTIR